MFDVMINSAGRSTQFQIKGCPNSGLACIDWRRQHGFPDDPTPFLTTRDVMWFKSEDFVRRYADLADDNADISIRPHRALRVLRVDGGKDLGVWDSVQLIRADDALTMQRILGAPQRSGLDCETLAEIIIRSMTDTAIDILSRNFDLTSEAGRQELIDSVDGNDYSDHPVFRFGETWGEWAQCICERWDALQEGVELPG